MPAAERSGERVPPWSALNLRSVSAACSVDALGGLTARRPAPVVRDPHAAAIFVRSTHASRRTESVVVAAFVASVLLSGHPDPQRRGILNGGAGLRY